MAEEGLTNSDLELKLVNQSNDLIKLQTNFNELQIKFNEEKEKTLDLEKKITFLENELKEIKEIADLAVNLKQLNNVTCKEVKFVEIKNKWKLISDILTKCCENNCINTDKPAGNCIEGNGFVNLISDGNIKYINCVEGKGRDVEAIVHAEDSFKRPQKCINYSLFYFEVKCKMERELNYYLNWMVIGVVNKTKRFRFIAKIALFKNEKNEEFKLSTFSWNDNDVFGCGLVYPPTNKITEEFPYIFFTQNGKQIGKNKD
ncbi:unnamed protein product [Meloidogyne enterolobii]|uniref:Uncharacterized protein n=1 Tax=Meloidogyne enterolobii TaxID=390850 RepID=A0ACB0Z9L5_MELEN